jgi:heavy metal sensor kinase
MYFGLRSAIVNNADRELGQRLLGIRAFLAHTNLEGEDLAKELRVHSGVRLNGDLYQLVDAGGHWIYRPESVLPLDIASEVPTESAASRYYTLQRDTRKYRILSSTARSLNALYGVQIPSNITPVFDVLNRFLFITLAAVPFVLIIAWMGGSWLSRRAMKPVYEITAAARTISERNLTARLNLPEPEDELRQLSETLNQMLGRLEEAFAKVTRFTADASHEFRTPVAIIRTTAELILQKERSVPEYQHLVGQILTEAEATTFLLEDMLLLARSDSESRSASSHSPLDLNWVVSEATSTASILADSKAITLTCRLHHGPLMISGDARSTRRLLFILLDNAVKYSPSGGSVSIGTHHGEEGAFLQVRDSGSGIAAEDLPNIFDRFYRADKGRSRGEAGVGLGLSLAKAIADAHHAEITVTSTPRVGTVFTVLFPPVATSPDSLVKASTAATESAADSFDLR